MADAIQKQAQITYDLVVVLLVLCWSTVALRLWVRLRITKSAGWDDAFMVLTLVFFTCYCSFILVINVTGFMSIGPTVDSFSEMLSYVLLSEVFYILTTTTLKISLGLFFLRILSKPWQVLVFHVILAVSAIYGVFYVFIAIFQCGDPSTLVATVHDTKQCLPTWFLLTTGYLYGTINVIADWTFVLIPICILAESNMDRRSKIPVIAVMGLGAIGSVSSILRMIYLRGLLFNGDFLHEAVSATIWATAEPGTGIVAASIAILRPLFRQIRGEVREKMSKLSSHKSQRTQNDAGSVPYTGLDDEGVGLTSVVVTTITGNAKASPQSWYALPSPMEETRDKGVQIEQAQIARVVHVRMTSKETS
ncbi:hypothetical protein EJ04DRAFT_452312 [Polyplosphaeria fusca]|uniref:Rhodopsin domain-containing protein n=1 Tax=Polyplosphaeria fusca TaxID=682080 RepID=A0A9P4QGQ5_9PLEO|nr:hypothetical protein EJ04DRAFT_452312 [Polyplosphaeria fusca]